MRINGGLDKGVKLSVVAKSLIWILMTRSYPAGKIPRYGPTNERDTSFYVVAIMLEHLKQDAVMSRRVRCETYSDHPVRDCAREILDKIVLFRATNPGADHIEIAFEILRLHTHTEDISWQPS